MIQTLTETGSTNSDLAARLRAGEAIREGDWLIADRQTAGKGRQGREWFDGSGNFMGSTIVRPSDRDPPVATLALVTGLALYEAVVPFLAAPGSAMLKWPNDLLINRAKLAGILLEGESGAVVVGIGVNLTKAPTLSDRETIALCDCGPAPSRDDFASSLAASFDKELERWRSFGLDPLLRRWQAAAHPDGTPLTVHEPGSEGSGKLMQGEFAGLAPGGSLRLRLADGSVRAIHAGDVSLT